MKAQVEAAIQASVFDVGVETLMAESLVGHAPPDNLSACKERG